MWTEFRIVSFCERVDRVWDQVSVDRVYNVVGVSICGQNLGSCKCLYVWTEFGIVRSLCTCRQRLGSCVCTCEQS